MPFPAWRKDLPLNVFYEIPGSAFSVLGLYHGFVDVYNSVANDIETGTLYSAGGSGHAISNDNGVFKINLMADAPVWSVVRASSAATSTIIGATTAYADGDPRKVNGYWEDRRPAGWHTWYYNHIIKIGTAKGVIGFANGAGNEAGTSKPYTNFFRLPSIGEATPNDWEKNSGVYPAEPTNWPTPPASVRGPVAMGNVDPRTNILYCSRDAFWTLDPSTRTWTQRASNAAGQMYYTGSCFDVSLNGRVSDCWTFYGAAGTEMEVWDATTHTHTRHTLNWLTAKPLLADESGMTSDDNYIYWISHHSLMRINKLTWDCENLGTLPQIPSDSEGTFTGWGAIYNRLAYMPCLGGLYYMPSGVHNIQFLPLTNVDPTGAPRAKLDVGTIGPNWNDAVPRLVSPLGSNDPMRWEVPGGDWIDSLGVKNGTTPFSSFTLSNYAIPYAYRTFDVTGIVQKWRDDEATGFLIHGTGTPPVIDSHTAAHPPILTIVTDVSTYTLPIAFCTYLVSGAGSQAGNGQIRFPGIIVPNLVLWPYVLGNITSATLQVYPSNAYTETQTYNIDYLNTPKLITAPQTQIGGVIQGIAANVATSDTELENHVDVIEYKRYDSYAGVLAQSHFLEAYNPTIPIPWNDIGCNAMRVEGRPGQGSPILKNWTYLVKGNPAHYNYAKQWVEGTGPLRLWNRILLKFPSSMLAAMTDAMKLPPTFDSAYTEGGGDYYRAGFGDQVDGFSIRLHCTMPSPANNCVMLNTYIYQNGLYDGENHKLNSGVYGAEETVGCAMLPDTVYCIDLGVGLNTFVSNVAQSNGDIEIRINGVPMFHRTGLKIRNLDTIRFRLSEGLIYQGGSNSPNAPLLMEVSGGVISLVYVGPPKAMLTGVPDTGSAVEITAGLFQRLMRRRHPTVV